MIKYIGWIFSLGIVMAMAVFGYLFINNLWIQDIIPELEGAVEPIIEDNGNDSTIRTLVLGQDDNMSAVDVKLDLIFFATWLGTTLFFFSLAYFTPPVSKFSFGTFIFIGLMVVLLWLNFVEQVFTWYVEQFITNVFSASETNLPIFTWYMENYIAIVTITLLAIALINQLGRKEPEEFDVAEETFSQDIDEDTQFSESIPEENNMDIGDTK